MRFSAIAMVVEWEVGRGFFSLGTGFLLPFSLILVMESIEYYYWSSLPTRYRKEPGRVLARFLSQYDSFVSFRVIRRL